MILILFWGVGISTTVENLAWLFLFGILANFTYNAQGFFIGLAVNDESDGAKLVNISLSLAFMMVNGVLINISLSNWFV